MIIGQIVPWVLSVWYRRTRSLDIKILWPSCKEQTPTIDRARQIFMFHALHDSAWLCLGEEKIKRIISGLQ